MKIACSQLNELQHVVMMTKQIKQWFHKEDWKMGQNASRISWRNIARDWNTDLKKIKWKIVT
jgi:hypothetical protein